MCEDTPDKSEEYYLGVLDTALFILDYVPAINENQELIANLERLISTNNDIRLIKFVKGNPKLKV
jgi:hypothetical protein